jgi:hypothetical protein
MEIGVAGDEIGIAIESAASLGDDGIEILDGLEVFVGERLVDKRPQMLGRLQFRRVGWLIDEANAIRDGQVLRRVPAGIVELQHDDAIAPGAGLAREGFEQLGEEGFADAVRQKPNGLAARGCHEGGDVEPLVAVVAKRHRPLTDRCPHPAMHWLQAEPVLVGGPHFDRFVGMFTGFLRHRVGELFLKAACSSGVAALGFFGRGDWIDQPIALSASHPRCG